MIAPDTNVLVRILTRDHPALASRAAALLTREDAVFIPKTVMLETEWVLRSAYKYSRSQQFYAFQQILAIANAQFEDEAEILKALGWYKNGMDFADALHVAASGPAPSFATFDRKLRRKLGQLAIPAAEEI